MELLLLVVVRATRKGVWSGKRGLFAWLAVRAEHAAPTMLHDLT
jgi:hypothetical protein